MRRLVSAFLIPALLAASVPVVAVAPKPIVAPDYVPQDKDERGLWMLSEELEREIKKSNFVIRDPDLNTYVRKVLCRTVGDEACKNVRIYVMRTPYFNAAMLPSGAMIVFSGLFLRTQNEAQLAAVLGHEYTHFSQRHSLRNFRDVKTKANAVSWLSLIPVVNLASIAAISLVQFGLLGSVFSFSRDMEREADAGSIPLLANAGYDPAQAAKIWELIRAEADATAKDRNQTSRKRANGGMFASHPNSAERMGTLKKLAEQQTPGSTRDLNRQEYRAALSRFWPDFVDDQIKLNDFGATEMLLAQLAAEGWTPELLFARGELYRARGRPEDFKSAADFYRQSIFAGEAPAEAWRGLGLASLRAGAQADGQQALKTYLSKRPDAKDRAMIAMLAGDK